MLLSAGAQPAAASAGGGNALHIACASGARSCVGLLVRWGAETGALKRATDARRLRPLEACADEGTRGVMGTLWEAAAAGDLDATCTMVSSCRGGCVPAAAHWCGACAHF